MDGMKRIEKSRQKAGENTDKDSLHGGGLRERGKEKSSKLRREVK
jgi:hypothetical protein